MASSHLRTLAALIFLLAGNEARAGDTWTTPFPGVKRLYRTTTRPWRIHALQVDLCARGVSMRATTSAEKWRRTSSFGSAVGAEAAINGDFFSYDTHLPTGQAIGNGTQWHDDSTSSGTIAFGPQRALIDLPGRLYSPAAGWVRNAVGGRPGIVVNGAVPSSFNRADCTDRHPRTAIGLSRDRQTLYMAVVDGRSSSSVGMTCGELGTLMRGLGAWTAMNLDGGGSSTMWARGIGLVNNPSDSGGERTVSNHLAVLADGSGAPASCDWSVDEPLLDASVLGDDDGTVDINGDGRADVCARAAAGFYCHPSTGSGFGSRFLLDDLSNNAGFGDAANYSTIRMGDIDGDGNTDVCARTDLGMRCWRSTGSGFSAPMTGPALADTSGWGQPQYYSTIRLADVTGDGKADICARAAAGIRCYPSRGTSFGPAFTGPALSDDSGWDEPHYYGTLRLADINGDGRADLCGRGANRLRCFPSTGTGFGAEIAGPAWSNASGFTDVAYWSTLRMVDVNGDGKDDACIRTSTDFRCHLSRGTSFGAAVVGPGLADSGGWADHSNYSTLRLGDIDGDGDLDVCARSNARVVCWKWTGADFGAGIDGPALADSSGWGDFRFYASMRLGDMNGDGRADLCARSSAGWRCWRSSGTGFGAAVEGPEWSDATGWSAIQYFSTIRFGGPQCRPELCNGRDDDCDGIVDNGTCGAPDAGVAADAGSPPAEDAGADVADASTAPEDAGHEEDGSWIGEDDAGSKELDASVIEAPDASGEELDASFIEELDGSAGEEDAGEPEEDAGTGHVVDADDGASEVPDASEGGEIGAGCTCATEPDRGTGVAGLLVVGGVLVRRRRRPNA